MPDLLPRQYPTSVLLTAAADTITELSGPDTHRALVGSLRQRAHDLTFFEPRRFEPEVTPAGR